MSNSYSSTNINSTSGHTRQLSQQNNLYTSNNSISTSISTVVPSALVNTSMHTGTIPKEKHIKNLRNVQVRKPPPTIDTFWPCILSDVRGIQQVDAKHQALPLARIKKIMKLDENAKMIAAEAPLLFAKACEYFIQELTMRAWIHTEESKRRTLQRSDIAQAIANYDQFDFLIDIVPREDIKPTTGNQKKEVHLPGSASSNSSTNNAGISSAVKMEQETINYSTVTPETLTTGPNQQPQLQILQHPSSQPQPMQYFITIPGQHSGQSQLVQQLQLQQLQNPASSQLTGLNLVTQPQQLILTAGPNGQLTATPATTAIQQQQQTALLQNLAQQQQHIQLLQQVVTPTGEVTNVPITINANQLNLLRLQMQQQQQQPQQQQIILPTQLLSTPQLLHLQNSANATNTTNSSPSHTFQLQHNQQQTSGGTSIFLNNPQTTQAVSAHQTNTSLNADRSLGSSFRTNC